MFPGIASAGTSILGGILGGIAAKRGAKNVADQYLNAEHGITGTITAGLNRTDTALDQARSDITGAQQNYQPYISAGEQGVQGLKDYAASNPTFNFDPSKYFNSAGYNFQLQQGTNAIQNQASAMGLGNSGNTLRDLTTFGQGLASTYYNNAFNQAQQQFQTNQNTTLQNLSALIGTGQFGTQGNSDLAKYFSGLNVGGRQAENAFQLGGSELAGNYAVGLGEAQAGGKLGFANNLVSGISGGLGGLAGIPGLFGSRGASDQSQYGIPVIP